MKSPRIVECSAERWRKCRCCETKRKKKNHPLRSPRKEAIFRRLAAIEFQSSKASETNGPIFETTTKLQPFRHEILPILLLFPPRRYTRHRNARLERDSHCPFVRGGQRTRRSGYVVPRLFQTWRTRRRTASPFDKERVERFDPFFFFSLLLPSLFRSILTGRRCEFLYLGVANCRTRSSNDANKRVARERLRERREKMVNKEEGRISDGERRSKSRIIEDDVAREECGRSRT